MKKIFLLLIVVYNLAFAEGDAGISIENIIQIDSSTLRLSTGDIKEDFVWIIDKKPFFSNLELAEKSKRLFIKPDVVGNYVIKLKIEGKEDITQTFTAESSTMFTEEELFVRVKNSKKTRDLMSLEKRFEELMKNFPESENMLESLNYLIELAEIKADYGVQERYINFLLKYYKVSLEEYEKYTKKLYEIYKERDEKEFALKKLLVLYDLDNKMYKKDLAKFYVENNISKKDGLEMLEEIYKSDFDIELGKFLGDYFVDENLLKAEEFYKYSDRVKLALIYFKQGQSGDLELLKEKLKIEELSVVTEKIENRKKEERANDYHKRAKASLKKYKFETAEFYYKRALQNTSEAKLKKSISYELAKLYFLERDYEKSLENFEEYLEKYGDRKNPEIIYYFAVIYYNLKDYVNSQEYLESILTKYPYTVWETKAKVYKLKIRNKKEI